MLCFGWHLLLWPRLSSAPAGIWRWLLCNRLCGVLVILLCQVIHLGADYFRPFNFQLWCTVYWIIRKSIMNVFALTLDCLFCTIAEIGGSLPGLGLVHDEHLDLRFWLKWSEGSSTNQTTVGWGHDSFRVLSNLRVPLRKLYRIEKPSSQV